MQKTAHNSREIQAMSVAAWFDPFISIAIIIGTYFALYKSGLSNVHMALLIIFFTSTYLFASELSRARWKFSDRPQQRMSTVLLRTMTKFLGVLVGIIAIYFAIWLFPEYKNAARIEFITQATLPFLAFIVPASFIVIFATEYILGEKRDGTYQFGLLARLQIREIDWNVFFDGVLEWLVRCIFLLINFFSASVLLSRLRATGVPDLGNSFADFVLAIDTLIFTVIIFSILPGYIFASRLIGTEVKKVDRTWFGWLITLSSYPPLYAAVSAGWLRYIPTPEQSGITGGIPLWSQIASGHPYVLYILGALIIFMALFHLWGEALLGIRSANLSMRGIITTGAFRFTKHPVYVSKCFQWGFLYLPFLNAIGFLDSFRLGILFLLMCAVFAGRALAEEKLLSEDKDYVKYALYMDDKSIFALVGRIVPIMTFRWRYEFWKRNGYVPKEVIG